MNPVRDEPPEFRPDSLVHRGYEQRGWHPDDETEEKFRRRVCGMPDLDEHVRVHKLCFDQWVGRQVVRVQRIRNLNCGLYEVCLSTAGKLGWPGFSCQRCPRYAAD